MDIQRLVLNEISYFGPCARKKVAVEFEGKKYHKAFFVTDNTLLDASISTKVLEELDSHFIPYEVYADVKSNPTVENVKIGVEKCKASEADCIIAVGGGSVIDTAKAIGIIMTNPEYEDVVSLDGVADTKNRSLPIIALPTTAGTAAEVTINYVITDPNQEKKMVCIDPHDIPVVAIVDTDLMKDMPKNLAAYTGMDALTHAMEGYLTKAAWTLSDMFHLEAIQLITDNIINAVISKDDRAIYNMGLAEYVAGMGFSNVGLGIVHSMAHQLGAVYDIAHGLANAVLLPYVLKYNGVVCPSRFRDMANVMHIDISSATDEEVIQLVVDKVVALNDQLGVPRRLREIGVFEADLPRLSEKAYLDVCTPGNPRETTPEAILTIYREAF